MKYGIYIHFPFCIHKCFYCDFYSVENTKLIDDFIKYLLIEIELRSNLMGNQKFKVDTIFFGGGTPSLINPSNLEKILNKINFHFEIIKDAEITLECNPGTVEIKFLEDYYKMGINRISFGVQSFIDSELKFLERIHSSQEAVIAYEIARKVGFENISLDLIFSLPNQELDNWKYSLDRAIELNPNHISAYNLIYEPGTPLNTNYEKGKIIKNSDDKDVEFYDITTSKLGEAGFEQYEVSNYTKNGRYCKHNIKYWNSDEYFSYGPSAVGIVNKERYKNISSLSKYQNKIKQGNLPIEYVEEMTQNILIFERIFLTLRALGLNLQDFQNDFGIDLMKIADKEINLFILNKFMFIENQTLKLTAEGYFIGDDITLKLADSIEKNSSYILGNT